jgi:hypothetical protein
VAAEILRDQRILPDVLQESEDDQASGRAESAPGRKDQHQWYVQLGWSMTDFLPYSCSKSIELSNVIYLSVWFVCAGEIEDSQGKGVIIQLELKDREYTLRALTVKEAQKWVKVLIQLRDGQSTNPGGLTSVKSGIDSDNSSIGSGSGKKSKSPTKKSATKPAELAAAKEIGGAKTNSCCGFF